MKASDTSGPYRLSLLGFGLAAVLTLTLGPYWWGKSPASTSDTRSATGQTTENLPWFIARNRQREVEFSNWNKTATVDSVDLVVWHDSLYRLTMLRGDKAKDGFLQAELIDHPWFPRKIGEQVTITWNYDGLLFEPITSK